MPRGAPKKPYGLRLDPALMDEVRSLTSNLTAAIEEALRVWIKKHQKPKPRTGK
jgi:hypothetical protein